MQIRKFEAPTIQEALDHIKRELGPEAIILQTKRNRRAFGLLSKPSFEVTAAVTEKALHQKQALDRRIPEKSRDVFQRLSAEKQAKMIEKSTPAPASARTRPATQRRYADIEDDGQKRVVQRNVPPAFTPERRAEKAPDHVPPSVQVELQKLKNELGEIRKQQEQKTDSPTPPPQGYLANVVLKELFDQLLINGMDRIYALDLVKQVSFVVGDEHGGPSEPALDQLAVELLGNTQVSSLLDGVTPRESDPSRTEPMIHAFVGPTGVGKTTTLAKIASEAVIRRKLKTALINIDTYKVAAEDQLASYARILKIPCRTVSTAADLETVMQDYRSMDLVLIDTTGRSQRDTESLNEMERLLHSLPSARTQLVLSATTRDQELYEMGKRFSVFRPEGLIVSKLDEAVVYGAIYNVHQKLKLPLVYFTTGQRVPEDIEEATRERMVSLLMDV